MIMMICGRVLNVVVVGLYVDALSHCNMVLAGMCPLFLGCILVLVHRRDSWAVNRSEDVLFNRRAFITNLKSDNNTHTRRDRWTGKRASAAEDTTAQPSPAQHNMACGGAA